MQSRITEPVVSKEEAERKAHEFLRARIGNIPHIRSAELKGDVWVIPIDVNYPKVFLSKDNLPIKTRFIKIANVGKIELSAINGDFRYHPRVWDIEASINKGMDLIRNIVEKALVKVGSSNFSILPFSELRYSPIIDILANLLTDEKFYLPDVTKDEFQASKYRGYVRDLERVGLVRISNDVVIPGNLFTVMEERLPDNAKDFDRLSALMSLFFERGYSFIESVRSVLGPHLDLSGFIYRESLEFGDLLSFTKRELRIMMDDPNKDIKIPRYLLQLERVGIIEEDRTSGLASWKPREEIFNNLSRENEILAPAFEMISNS